MLERTTCPAPILPIDLWTEVLELADPFDILPLMQVQAVRLPNPSDILLDNRC